MGIIPAGIRIAIAKLLSYSVVCLFSDKTKLMRNQIASGHVCGARLLFALFLAVLGQLSAQAADVQILHGHVPAAVARLQPLGRLPATNQLRLAIGLPLRNPEALASLLRRIYDPNSPDYHHYLTSEQFAEQFGPSSEDYQALTDFVNNNGLKVTATHPNRTLLDIGGSVAGIEKLLHVTLRVYPHPKEARNFFAPATEPSLDLAVPVLHISGLDDFVLPHPMNLRATPLNVSKGATPAFGSGPGGTYMGNDFRAAYVPGTTLTGAGQIVGLVEFDGYFPGDVAAYRYQAGLPDVPLKNVLLDEFNGAPGGNNVEVSLDIDMATCMAPGLSGIIVYEGEVPDDVLNRMATDDLAKQLSASWTYSIDTNTEQIFQQFGAQGQSFFNAAGDSDAYADGVDTPADDPNITVVGGTTLMTSGPGGSWISESVWNWGGGIGTGGGISTTYPIPIWQQGISMASNNGSTTMRNLPDVALTADNIWLIYDNGAAGEFGGTSCATPLWAALTALINQQALANGKPTQGFINPAIYALASGPNYAATFHDITIGNNTSSTSPTNFYAVPGFDLCTGWGTPNGTNLINILAPLDALRVSSSGGFTAGGGAGGPFTVLGKFFFLTNTGTSALNWAVGNTVSWLNVSPSIGTLPTKGSTALVYVSLNGAANTLVPGAYGATIQFTNLNDGFAQSRQFTLNVITAPILTISSTNQAVLGGATAVFTSQAIGGLPLSFQWQQNGTNLTDGANISGSATPVLTVANVSVSNVGSYTVVVSNAATVVTSTPPALLTIIPSGPVITLQPISQYVLIGATANFTVAVLGNAPLSYQWQQNATNLSDGGSVSGSATSSLTLIPVSATNAGTYTVIVSNSLNTVTSTGAVFTVYALADMQMLQNGGFETGDFSFWNLTGNSGFDTVSTGSLFDHSSLYGAEMGPIGSLGYISQTVPTTPGETYLLSFWLNNLDGATPNEFLAEWNGYILSDQTNLSAFGWSNFQYAVTATAASTTVEFGFRDDTSFLGLDDVSLKPLLNPGGAPVITNQPPTQTFVVAGGTAAIMVGATGLPPLSYQWLSNTIPIPGGTNATLNLTNAAANEAGTYSVIIINSSGYAVSSNAVLFVLTGNMELVTFDDLGTTNLRVPNSYAGLSWSNFYHMDTALSAPNPSGYIVGTISQPNAAFNSLGTPAVLSNSTPFDFLSAWLTAAWNDNLRLEVKGYANNTLAYDNAYILSATVPTLITFNYIGVTNIEFISSGGTPDPGYGGSGTEFVMDNASLIADTGPPPPNDLCSGAIVVSSDPYTNIQSTLGATSAGDPTPTCISNFANGVWYQYTPPASGQLEVNVAGSGFAAGVAVYTGSCGSLTQAACNENAMTMPVTGGTIYYILAGASENLAGNLVFELSFSSVVAGPPVILTPPVNASVAAGSAATFTVSAEGAKPLTYFWAHNGLPIAGATAPTYTINNVQLSNSGAEYSCLVSNSLGVTNSSTATLNVTVPGQLVQNGGFETGDFSYWTESGTFEDTYVNSLFVHSGQYGAALGPVGSLGYLSQALPTSAGQLYLLSLWLYSIPAEFPNEFSVAWNGATLFDQTNLDGLDWTNLQFNVTSSTASAVLKIGFRNDPSYLGLDDISVLPLKPVLQNVTQTGTAITFGWSALPGYLYQIESTTNLAQANWAPVDNSIIASNYIMTTSETIITNTPQFYRVVLMQ